MIGFFKQEMDHKFIAILSKASIAVSVDRVHTCVFTVIT